MLLQRTRGAALATLAGLGAGLLMLVLPGAPAQAAPGCMTEAKDPLLGVGCDDDNPPVTDTGAVTITGLTATFTGTAHYTDADKGSITFQCQLGSGAWGGCVFPGLAAGSYTAAIRAVDSADAAITAYCPPVLCSGPEAPDYDATPVTLSLTVNPGGGGTGGNGTSNDPPVVNPDPDTFISKGPVDRITPGVPVALSRHPKVLLSASKAATFRCAINAHKVACHGGLNVLKKLKPGPQVFVAQAVDAAGNFDKTPAALPFYVPINARAAGAWHHVKSRGSYAGDYVATGAKGAVLTLAAVKGVREVRVIAPAGPRLGTLAIRVGHSGWFKVKLTSKADERLAVFVVRNASAKPLSGPIQVKALRVPARGAVAIDAVVAR